MPFAVSDIAAEDLLLIPRFRFACGEIDRLGICTRFVEPIRDHVYALGADPAQGLVDGDKSALQVFDCSTNPVEQVFEAAGRYEPDIFARLIYAVARHYNGAFVVVEAQGGGLTVARELWRAYEYRNLYRNRTLANIDQPVTDKLGYTRGKDCATLDDFRNALRDGELLIRSQDLIDEMARLEWYNPRDKGEKVEGEKVVDAGMKLRLRGGAGQSKSPDKIRAAEYAWLGVNERGRQMPEDIPIVNNRHGDADDLREAFGKGRRRVR